MTNKAKTSPDIDHCAVCKGNTNGPDVAFHWANARSARMIAVTCSDACCEKFEVTRQLVDGLA